MANKRDVTRARVAGMNDVLALYKSCRRRGQDEPTALESVALYIKTNEI